MLKNLFVQMTLRGWRRIDLAEKSGVPAWQIVRCIKHPKLYKFKIEEKVRIAEALEIGMNRIEWLFEEAEELNKEEVVKNME